MKKILIIAAFLLFILSVMFFIHFGPQIRDNLSPVVECTEIAYSTLDGRTYPTLPEEAVLTDEAGMTYIYIIESTDEYPETAYKAVRKDVIVVQCADGIHTFSCPVYLPQRKSYCAGRGHWRMVFGFGYDDKISCRIFKMKCTSCLAI